MAGHCHPAVMKAVEKRLSTGTMYGMPHDMEWELAEEICNRFPVEMVRFGNSARKPPCMRFVWHALLPAATKLLNSKALTMDCMIPLWSA